MENGSSCPGSPTNRARSKRPAMSSSMSERIWYASSTIAQAQRCSLTVAHLAAVASTTSACPRSSARLAIVMLGRASRRSGALYSVADRRPMRSVGCSAASRRTRSSIWLLVCATIMQRSPPSTRVIAALTTSVVFPAPGGESTTRPRRALAAMSAMSARIVRTVSSAAATGSATFWILTIHSSTSSRDSSTGGPPCVHGVSSTEGNSRGLDQPGSWV